MFTSNRRLIVGKKDDIMLRVSLFSQAVSFIFHLTVCIYPHVSVSFALSLSKRGGKDTHPAALAAAAPPPPLRKFPICLCAGLAERSRPLLKQRPMYTLIGKHAHACRAYKHGGVRIHTLFCNQTDRPS